MILHKAERNVKCHYTKKSLTSTKQIDNHNYSNARGMWTTKNPIKTLHPYLFSAGRAVQTPEKLATFELEADYYDFWTLQSYHSVHINPETGHIVGMTNNNLKYIAGFPIDIDYKPLELYKRDRDAQKLWDSDFIKPTAMMNTDRGLQLIYSLSQAIDVSWGMLKPTFSNGQATKQKHFEFLPSSENPKFQQIMKIWITLKKQIENELHIKVDSGNTFEGISRTPNRLQLRATRLNKGDSLFESISKPHNYGFSLGFYQYKAKEYQKYQQQKLVSATGISPTTKAPIPVKAKRPQTAKQPNKWTKQIYQEKIVKIKEANWPVHSRHKCMTHVVLAFKSSGVDKKRTLTWALQKNEQITCPLPENEVINIVKDIYRGPYKGASRAYTLECLSDLGIDVNSIRPTWHHFKKTETERVNLTFFETVSNIKKFFSKCDSKTAIISQPKLATKAKVKYNPNQIQRALKLLVKQGLIIPIKSVGKTTRYLINQGKIKLLKEQQRLRGERELALLNDYKKEVSVQNGFTEAEINSLLAESPPN